jgi:hypothetical protein
MILREELEIGALYEVEARNFQYAFWNGQAFEGRRFKLGEWFWSEELYWDDHPHYGTVKPIRKVTLEELPDEAAKPYATYRWLRGHD